MRADWQSLPIKNTRVRKNDICLAWPGNGSRSGMKCRVGWCFYSFPWCCQRPILFREQTSRGEVTYKVENLYIRAAVAESFTFSLRGSVGSFNRLLKWLLKWLVGIDVEKIGLPQRSHLTFSFFLSHTVLLWRASASTHWWSDRWSIDNIERAFHTNKVVYFLQNVEATDIVPPHHLYTMPRLSLIQDLIQSENFEVLKQNSNRVLHITGIMQH